MSTATATAEEDDTSSKRAKAVCLRGFDKAIKDPFFWNYMDPWPLALV